MRKAKKIFLSNRNRYKNELEKIYSFVPEGTCSGCGNCCFESVGASYTEAYNIYFHLTDRKLLDDDLLRRMLEYYFDIYSKRHRCPFLDEKRQCAIYDVRPLNCRIYGHWTKNDYNYNYERLQTENKKTAKSFMENADILIDEKYIDFKIPYCESFKGEILSKDKRNILYDDIIKIDSDFIAGNGLNLDFKDKGIVEHLLCMIFSENKLEQIHMVYLKNKDRNLLNKKINRMISIAHLYVNSTVTCSGGKNV